ncbi:unnamed protein product [Arctia plantaginis]|uniref:FLYWCH-type domain-containing protein n=1 Tax=Arctia plantaginis TaxID=874455 RepID=A0A8S1AVS8_ARCPL|nr:unnamed protein product [Arctia plantaginis]
MRRGARILCMNNYSFSKHHEVSGKTRWKCSKCSSKGCKASVTIIDGSAFFTTTDRGARILWIQDFSFSKHSDAQYVTSVRGARQLVLNGYTYCVKHVLGSKLHWICSTHHSKGCRAKVHTMNDSVCSQLGAHTHPPRLISHQVEILTNFCNDMFMNQ